MSEVHTFCRICEASCGLIAEIDNQKILSFKPNKAHIGTDGFACMKGLNQHKMYDSPDRLKYPLKKINGQFERISWQQAIQEIGTTVKRLKSSNPNSIGMYVGTAAGFSILHPIFAEGFMQGIGSHNIFSSSTQDCANRFATSTEMYGFPFHSPFADLDHVKCMLILGTNPVVSKWTFLQVAHPVKRLKEIIQRGAEVIVIDPRNNETANIASDYIAIQPNTDVFFLLSFLHEIILQEGCNQAVIDAYTTGFSELKQLVNAWPAERTEGVTGITSGVLKALVTTYLTAGASAIVTGTGLGMGENGTLAQWLVECITVVSGNLDRQGGMLVGEGLFDFAEFSIKHDLFSRELTSRIGGFPQLNGGFPGGILADEILTEGDGQIKAMFVTGGNPLLTMANSERLKTAFQHLDMLVVTDIYLNETASLADYVLPATSPLQRPDLPFIFPLFLGMQSKPYIAATEAIVPIEGEQRDESSIYTELAMASGTALFDSALLQCLMRVMRRINIWRSGSSLAGVPQTFILDLLLRFNGEGSFKALTKHGNGKAWKGPKPGTLLGKRIQTDDGKVKLAPALFVKASGLLNEHFDRLRDDQSKHQLKLITKRVHSTHNSWTQNIDELTHGKMGSSNYLYMHPNDARQRSLEEDSVADIKTETGHIRLAVKFTADLLPGCVAVQHGWGHQHAIGLTHASSISGANVNILASDGPENIERVSGMAHLTGIPVDVSLAKVSINQKSWSGV